MRQAEPFGFFLGRSGEAVDMMEFAGELNMPPKDVRAAILDLEKNSVFQKDGQGRIYCKRYVVEYAKRLQNVANGKLGGSPLLRGSDNRVGNILTPNNRDSINQIPDNPNGITEPDKRSLVITNNHNTDSLRSSALDFGEWPTENEFLRALALIFLAAFGNCHDPLKAEKHLPAYMGTLAAIRSRGYSISEAWTACDDALDANNGKPLFSAAIRTALMFLPPKPSGEARHSRPDPTAGVLLG